MYMHAVKYLLLLLMSAHGIFGCCWHHVHSCASDGDGSEVEVACHEDHCHAHKHQDEGQHEDAATDQESPHDEDACDEEACVYVHASQIQGEYQFNFDLALDQAFCCDIHLLAESATVFAALRRSDQLAQTTGERCARLQTWLI